MFCNQYNRTNIIDALGIGCGSVGRAVDSNTRGPRFESSHWQNLYWALFTVSCIENKEKEAGNWLFL